MGKLTIQIGAGKPQWFQKDSDQPQAFYRYWPFAQLAKGIADIHVFEEPSVNLSTLHRADWCVFHTPMDTSVLGMISACKSMGVKVWVDMDDLVLAGNIPASNPAAFFFRPKSVQETLLFSLQAADVVSVTTQGLKFGLIQAGINPNKIHVIPNALPDAIWAQRQAPSQRETARVMWRGSITHEGDLYRFREAFKNMPGIEYLFFGSEPWVLYQRYEGHLTEVMLKDWRAGMFNYISDLKEEKPTWCVVPLENIPFNHSKSNIAFLESTLAGAVTIAPAYMPEFNLPGVWTFGKENPKGQQHYAHELGAIFKRIAQGVAEEARMEMYREAERTIEANYLLSVTNRKRLELLQR
jgi:hypothetical protein